MTTTDLLNNWGAVASILGFGVVSIATAAFRVGMWWKGHGNLEATRQQALRDICAAITQTKLESVQVERDSYARGQTIAIRYEISSTADIEMGVWLGASLWTEGAGRQMYNSPTEDKPISLKRGRQVYTRSLTVPVSTPPGVCDLNVNVWFGDPSPDANSHVIHARRPLKKVQIT